uniref:Uncharacterized protein n=1 Tax=Panagrolaimus sp. JU765 TaxID=591449 RepID=A0AC34QJU1_9BILA
MKIIDVTAEIIDQCKTLSAMKYLTHGLADECFKLQCQTLRATQELKEAKAEVLKVKEVKETNDLYNMLALDKIEKPAPLFDDVENDADAASVKSSERDKERRKTKGPDELLYGGTKGTLSRHSRTASSPEPLRELNRKGSADDNNVGNSYSSLDDPGASIPSVDEKLIKYNRDIPAHNIEVRTMDVNDLLVATGARDRGCNVSDLETGSLLAQLGPHENTVRAVKFVPNTSMLITASYCFLRMYDLRCPEEIIHQFQSSGISCNPTFSKLRIDESTVPYSEFIVNCFDIDASGSYLYAPYGNEAIRCFDIRSRSAVCKIDLHLNNALVFPGHNRLAHIDSLCVSHLEDSSGDLQIVTAHSNSPEVSVVRYSPGMGVVDVSPLQLRTGSATCAVCVGDNIFTANANGRLTRYVGQKRDISVPNAHLSPIMSMKLVDTTNETLLATGCSGGYVNFWRFQGSHGLTRVSTGCKAKGQVIAMASNERNFLVSSSGMKGYAVYDMDPKDI